MKLPDISDFESESNVVKLDIFTKYLNYIEDTQNVKSCYANSHLINEHIEINFRKLEYSIPYDYSNKLKKCLSDQIITYIIIPVSLVYNDYSHYNIVIINKEKQTFEYFEPVGFIITHELPYFEVQSHIYGIVNYIFNDNLLLKNFKFVNANINCPMGLQKKQMDAFDQSFNGQYGPLYKNNKMYAYYGLCVGWCLLIIHLRILNPEENINNIVEYLIIKYNSLELHNYIRRYIHLIENTNNLESANTYIKKNTFKLKLTKNEIKNNTRYIKKFNDDNNITMLKYFTQFSFYFNYKMI